MDEIRDEIYQKIDQLYGEAVHIQRVWMKQVAEREINRTYRENKKSESTNYEFRIELSECSFSLRWFRVQFFKSGNKTNRIRKAIAIPASGKYKATQFRYAEDWELQSILQMEDVLSNIRVKVKHLMKMHHLAIAVSNVDNNKLITIPIKERVELPPYSIKKFKEQLC
ncbi:conjugative transfer protein MobI(A/C) [Vibrio marisflavi]|uniref:Uncharacterized protein n=1 Tax=Vibrio marisflavi CECT 7928 TaxID=634439 RepID=A0ABN8EAT3_9VIBR|nr:conjugative transfer protein MobI(A/C) [Vibrio marisflavi]CAH0543272.1 hypothetical protein VMF7928_04500 [Vibrio marisflavi CECT 7928]